MNSNEVIRYLKENPNFFEEHAETISRFSIRHPYDDRVISITDYQLLSIRDQNKALENRMHELIRFGEENDILGEKMHRLSVALIASTTLQAMVQIVIFHLKKDFGIPHVAIRLWSDSWSRNDQPKFTPVSKELRTSIEGLVQPYCGAAADYVNDAGLAGEISGLFGTAGEGVRSQTLIALRNSGGSMGVIAMGSEEVKRFHAGTGTLYLERLGEMVSAALARVLRQGSTD